VTINNHQSHKASPTLLQKIVEFQSATSAPVVLQTSIGDVDQYTYDDMPSYPNFLPSFDLADSLLCQLLDCNVSNFASL
jgi:hypothetical protein